MESLKKIRCLLESELARKKILIAVHRGVGCGNIVENTVAGLRTAFVLGGDMAELDAAASKDGIIYTIHDGSAMQLRLTGQDVSVCELSSAEIDQLVYRNNGAIEAGRIERLEQVLAGMKGCGLINVDRAFLCWEKALQILVAADMPEQLLIKSPVRQDLLEMLERCPVPFMYMPIVYSPADLEEVRRFRVNTVGYELIFSTESDPLLDKDLHREITMNGEFLWANAIDLGGKFNLTAHHNDTKALLESPEENWGWLIDRGFTVIQTDFPSALRDFRNRYIS